jgi:hypothetical protein
VGEGDARASRGSEPYRGTAMRRGTAGRRDAAARRLSVARSAAAAGLTSRSSSAVSGLRGVPLCVWLCAAADSRLRYVHRLSRDCAMSTIRVTVAAADPGVRGLSGQEVRRPVEPAGERGSACWGASVRVCRVLGLLVCFFVRSLVFVADEGGGNSRSRSFQPSLARLRAPLVPNPAMR